MESRKITKRHFKTLKTLTSFINHTFTYFNEFIFRGQSNADWKLESSLTRSFKNEYKNFHKMSSGAKTALVSKHLSSFKENIRGRCNINYKDISEDELWSLGQHFGLHTPLLDWTSSPYVALYFALEYQSTAKKACIWAISENFLSELKASRVDLNLKRIKPLSNENPRLVSQQGLFLRVPIDKSVEEVITIYNSNTIGVNIFKLTFDTSIRPQVLSALNNMNINKLTLYPDLVGAALHTNYQFEIRPHLLRGQSAAWDRHIFDVIKKGRLKIKKIGGRLRVEIKNIPVSFYIKNRSELKAGLKKALTLYAKKANRGVDITDTLLEITETKKRRRKKKEPAMSKIQTGED